MCTVPKYTLDNPINLIQYALTFDYQKAHQTVKCKLPKLFYLQLSHSGNAGPWGQFANPAEEAGLLKSSKHLHLQSQVSLKMERSAPSQVVTICLFAAFFSLVAGI